MTYMQHSRQNLNKMLLHNYTAISPTQFSDFCTLYFAENFCEYHESGKFVKLSTFKFTFSKVGVSERMICHACSIFAKLFILESLHKPNSRKFFSWDITPIYDVSQIKGSLTTLPFVFKAPLVAGIHTMYIQYVPFNGMNGWFCHNNYSCYRGFKNQKEEIKISRILFLMVNSF